MKYKIVTSLPTGGMHVEEIDTPTREQFLGIMQRQGYKLQRWEDAYNFADGRPRRITLRDDLHMQPVFTQLVGPMFDGPGVVRYEDDRVYDILSR